MARLNSRLGIAESKLINSNIQRKGKLSSERQKDIKEERVVRDTEVRMRGPDMCQRSEKRMEETIFKHNRMTENFPQLLKDSNYWSQETA